MPTDFPKQGDDLAVSLRNSEVPRFDYEFADLIRVDHPDIWDAGGNIRGNDAFGFWTRARQDDDADVVLDWIKEREAWAARHAGDGQQFPEDPARMSNIAGVVAAMKWGVVLDIGMDTMKNAVMELVKYLEDRATDCGCTKRAWDDDLSASVATGVENAIEAHNEDIEPGDDVHRATLTMGGEVFRRGVGAYNTNPESVRPNVSGPEQWAYARLRSFLFALKNERFQGGQHDTDLFPDGHPLRIDDEDERARVGEIDGTPVFSTKAEAEAEAEKMGCSGYHTHEFEGETVYMPCSSHGDATGGGGGYRNHKELNDTMERRYFTTTIETRVEGEADDQRIEGYAAVFDASADLGNFTETIDRDAFANVMANHDCRALFNHDPNFPLARSVNGQGTLDLKVDENGLWFSFPVGPQSYARDLHESIKRGDVNQASFAFTVEADKWSTREGRSHRHITELGDLLDVAVVTYPAYEQTAVVARNVQPPTSSDAENKSTTGQPPKWDKMKWSRAKLDALKHRKK